MSEEEFTTEHQIINKFQDLRQSVNALWTKINELESEAQEHALVLSTLEPMDPKRKCFRLIGDVLVERTVAETAPAVKRHKDNLEAVIKKLHADLESKKQELSDFQTKHKIRIRGADEEDETPRQEEQRKKGESAQGVLVSKGAS